MAPRQINATKFNPDNLSLTEIATYQRRIHANIDRVWENVLDWEHLPWLHQTSFNYVELVAAGEWGWRTWSNKDHSAHVELVVDREKQRYVARSYANEQQVSEIWTRLESANSATDIDISFNVVNVMPSKKKKLGNIYLSLYKQLWDEDEEMMSQRHRRLTDKAFGPSEIHLGKRQALEAQLPLTLKLGRSNWLIRQHENELIVHSAICPHLLGPLEDKIVNGKVTCPWHGYKFDILTGHCSQPEDAKCRLPQPPKIHQDPRTSDIILKV